MLYPELIESTGNSSIQTPHLPKECSVTCTHSLSKPREATAELPVFVLHSEYLFCLIIKKRNQNILATSESLDLPTCWHQGSGPLSTQLNHSHSLPPGQTWGLNHQFQVQLKPLVSAPLREIKRNKPGLLPFHSLSPRTFAVL